VTTEETTKELIALRDYFRGRDVDPPDAVVVMTGLIVGVVRTFSLTTEQRENGVGALQACIDELNTTQ
jgi:hypothetical protein